MIWFSRVSKMNLTDHCFSHLVRFARESWEKLITWRSAPCARDWGFPPAEGRMCCSFRWLSWCWTTAGPAMVKSKAWMTRSKNWSFSAWPTQSWPLWPSSPRWQSFEGWVFGDGRWRAVACGRYTSFNAHAVFCVRILSMIISNICRLTIIPTVSRKHTFA